MVTRTINDVKNPRWADQKKSMVVLEVDFDELDEEYVEFAASPLDSMDYGRFLFEQAVSGAYGPIAEFEPPEDQTGEVVFEAIRSRRNKKLASTDYIEVPSVWSSLTPEKQVEWSTYRQALRDVPQNNPNAKFTWVAEMESMELVNVEWPQEPS